MAESRAAYAVRPEHELHDDQHILNVGQQCSSPTCSLVDFLPFKCQHCSESFCGDHFLPDKHSCEKYDASKFDRIAPQCPLCNINIAVPPGIDPNIRMERHITTECSVMNGHTATKTSSIPTCARGKCNKKLYSPISCEKCHKQFCPEHRYPTSHACAQAVAATQLPSRTGAASRAIPLTAAASKAAMAALNRTAASTSAALSSKPAPRMNTARIPPSRPIATSASASSSSSPTKTGASSISNPFSKTDRRAGQERASMLKAKQARYDKGLMSAAEKAKWEEEKEELLQQGDKKDCVVM